MSVDFKNQILALCLVTTAFIGLSIYYDMGFWLTQKPCSVHVWRQSDCTSYALNYFQNDRSLFSPQVHHRHAIDGNTCSEFPIIYFGASYLYRWFGFHDYYIRWIDYLIYFASLICITLTARYYIKNWILSTFPAILLMLSCLIGYYGANYLPDVPALSFALIGFYFFIRYTHSDKNYDFGLAVAFSTLAALLKISSAILFIAMALYVFYRKFIKKDQTYTRANIFVTLSGFLVVFGWLFFVHVYNNLGQYFGNLQGTFGVWLCDKNVFFYIIKRTFEEWMPAMVSRKIWLFFIPIMIYLIYSWKKLDGIFQFFLPIVFFGCSSYLILFYRVFDVHDYYFINLFCFPVILSIAFFSVLEQNLSIKNLRIFLVLAGVLFAMCAEDAEAQFEHRRYDTGWNSSPPKAFYTIEPYLRSLGIDRHELVYSPSDGSTNVTLYLANNPGWTKLFGVGPADANARGAKYMLILTSQLEEPEFSAYKDRIIGEYEGVSVIKF